MANDLNLCQFIGRLGKDPEVRYTQSGTPVATFSIAVGHKYKDQESTEWVRCQAWSKLAEICGEYLRKGSQVYVSGRMQTRKWTNKEGQDQYTTEINVDRMQMLGGRREPEEARPHEGQTATAESMQAASQDFDDDIPWG